METFNTCLGNRVNLETLPLTIRLVAHSSLLANRAVSISPFSAVSSSKQASVGIELFCFARHRGDLLCGARWI